MPRHPHARELRPDDLRVRDRLRLLTGHDHHAAAERLESVRVQPRDVAVADEEPPPGDPGRPEPRLAQQPGSDVGRIVAGVARRPQHLRPRRQSFERFEHPRHLLGAARRDGDIGERGVDRLARRVQPRELVAVAGERTSAALRSGPRDLEVDVDPHDEVLPQRGAHGIGGDRAAPEGQHGRVATVQQLERHLLLYRAERGLPVLGEHPLDRFSEPLLDRAVDVDRLGPERPRHARRRGRLSRAHEPDADDRAVGGAGARKGQAPFHPIRSS